MADGGRFDRELEGIPQAQKGPPRWMFFAGCGCLVPGFILVIVMWFTYQMIRELVDQKTAWEALADVVAFDDAARGTPSGEEDDLRTPQDESWDPPEFELVFGGPIPFSGGLEAYWFGRDIRGPLDPEGEYGENAMLVTFLKTKSDQAEAATEAPPGTPLHEDMTLEVQGRALRGRRIPEMVSDDLLMQASGLDEVRGAGAALWLREGFTDPNEEGESFDLLVFFQRPNSSDPIRDEEMRSFLEPFDVADPAPTGSSEESAEDDDR